jgi:hypothetical protein
VKEYKTNCYLRFLPGDLLWYLRVDSKQRFQAQPNWFRFFDPSMSYQICNLRDPGPIIGYLLENFIQMLFDSKTRRARLRLDESNLRQARP